MSKHPHSKRGEPSLVRRDPCYRRGRSAFLPMREVA
jgi:hypothetical protein